MEKGAARRFKVMLLLAKQATSLSPDTFTVDFYIPYGGHYSNQAAAK